MASFGEDIGQAGRFTEWPEPISTNSPSWSLHQCEFQRGLFAQPLAPSVERIASGKLKS